MKLFIMGNGFDLAHGLPTKYWDFRSYLENLYPDFLDSFEQHYYIYPGGTDEYKKELLWNDFETNLANINEDVIIEDAVSMDLGLESGDYGIEDTLRVYFREEYQYINQLAKYLKQWVRTIRLMRVAPRTSMIDKENDDYFITFNYTSVLENVYGINPADILHIHGSLHSYTDDPILGHGNINRIQNIQAKKSQAESYYNEKEMSICTVLQEYYETTLKNVNRYIYKLSELSRYNFDEIVVIGHSVAGIDLPYFKCIDEYTKKQLTWNVYYYCETEKDKIATALRSQGVDNKRLKLISCNQFYNM